MIDIFQGPGTPLTAEGLTDALNRLSVEEPQLWAVLAVETTGFGYLPDRRPQILFERHIFHKRTQGRFSAANPDISNPTPGGYAGGTGEYLRLKRAMLLDETSALESASWGLGQIMGYHAQRLKYRDVHDMVDQFILSENSQLGGCARFVVASSPMLAALQGQNWARFAYFYNGGGYAKNRYDQKLLTHYTAFKEADGLPDLTVRSIQANLTYLGFAPGPVDGQMGNKTSEAVQRFYAARRKMPSADRQTVSADVSSAVADLR